MLNPSTQSIVDNAYMVIPSKKWNEANKKLSAFLRNLVNDFLGDKEVK